MAFDRLKDSLRNGWQKTKDVTVAGSRYVGGKAWSGMKKVQGGAWNKVIVPSYKSIKEPVLNNAITSPVKDGASGIKNRWNEPFSNTSTWMLVFAIIINFWIEVKVPAFRFTGFSLNYFKSTIMGGDWVGIYNIFHFNIFFLAIIFAYFNLRSGKPHILKVWLSFILVTYLLSSIPSTRVSCIVLSIA